MFSRNPQKVPNARPSVRDYVSDRVFEGKRKLSPAAAARVVRAAKKAQSHPDQKLQNPMNRFQAAE